MLQLRLDETTAALRRIPVYLVDDIDGKTPETGVTFSAGDIKISKNGAGEANHGGSVTELAGGLYYYEATAGELDTEGFLTARFIKAGVRTYVSQSQVQNPVENKVWNELLTGSAHNVTNSAGKRLREHSSVVITSGFAQGAGSDLNQIQLAEEASSLNGAYDPSVVAIINGTGAGQCRLILQYDGDTRLATVDRGWKVNPDTDSEYIIMADPGREHVNEGLAQVGSTSTTIKLNALASDSDEAYSGQTVFIRSGTGEDQKRVVHAYNGTTKVATLERAWEVTPDATSAYVMIGTDTHGQAIHAIEDLLTYDLSTVTGEAARSLLNALRKLRNKVDYSSSPGTVYKEDDTTVAWTEAFTTDSDAAAIVETDPT